MKMEEIWKKNRIKKKDIIFSSNNNVIRVGNEYLNQLFTKYIIINKINVGLVYLIIYMMV